MKASQVDMNALVNEAWKEVQASSPEIAADFRLQPLPLAWGDRALLKQVWINLLSNAMKYSAKRDKPVVEVGGDAQGSMMSFCVKDNGAGFDMRYADKLFGVFQRLHREEEFSGTGIGLAIVQRVVIRHGGRVWAEGKKDEGAAFFFSLPGDEAKSTEV
jgi:light-regulated signal transduction histidine kinase (bacteriophytochrome)